MPSHPEGSLLHPPALVLSRQLLSPGRRSREDVVDAIHSKLREVREKLETPNGVGLGSFIITKQLTKNPSDYPDAKNQPHVQVGAPGNA